MLSPSVVDSRHVERRTATLHLVVKLGSNPSWRMSLLSLLLSVRFVFWKSTSNVMDSYISEVRGNLMASTRWGEVLHQYHGKISTDYI